MRRSPPFGRFLTAKERLIAASPNAKSERPSCDSSGRVLFSIALGGELVACAISHCALEDLHGGSCRGAAATIAFFEAAQSTIEELAKQKYRLHGAGIYGRVNLWASDIDGTSPRHGAASRPRRRHAA